jgi:O-antigen/teichoic acid export membrane protein
MSSLKKLAIRGAVWTIASYGASQLLRFGSNLILTRLLEPKLFGLMALIYIFIIGVNLFSDVGLGPSIIQNKRGDDPTFLNTAWTMQVIRGFGLWFCILAIAGPVAKFYGEPQLLWLLPIVGLTTIFNGFNSTALFTLNRHMAIGKLAVFELGIQVISLAVMNTWAWFSPNVWAIVAGSLTGDIVRLVWSHRLNREVPNHFNWDREAVNAILSFGKWIFISTAITFLAEQIDRLMLGKLLSFELLGVYGIAFTLADMPRQILAAIVHKVMFPALSKLSDLPRDTFRTKLLQNRWPILVSLVLGLTILVSFGDLLILVLYDNRYTQASWMLPLLALGIWPRILAQTIDAALLALGKPIYSTCGNFLKFSFMVVGLPLGFSFMGLAGAIIVVALNDLPLYGAVTYGICREGMTAIVQDIKATALILLLLIAVLTCRFALGFGFPIQGIL